MRQLSSLALVACCVVVGCGGSSDGAFTGPDATGADGGDDASLLDGATPLDGALPAEGGDDAGDDGGFVLDSPPPDVGCTPTSCMAAGASCGSLSDGCGGSLSCGACMGLETCGGGGTANRCGCSPTTCAAAGANCGMIADACGGMLDCGTCAAGLTCGGDGTMNVCGVTPCVPKTCAALGVNCGSVGDGCGAVISCGSCTAPQTCGGGGTPSVCGAPVCVPKTCAGVGATCGALADGCGGLLSCGTCASPQVCGGSGTSNVCSVPATCTNLCLKQVTCPVATVTTTVTGTVFAPNGTDPLPNTLVFVPNAAVLPFAPGVACESCGASTSGSPLVSAVTGVDGTFTLKNVPVGTNIPLVIQNGRWRRQFTIPSVTACVNTALPSSGTSQLRMPRTKAEGDLPLMGFVTGSVDALECVLRKIGIADSEFSNPSGAGRVRFYKGAGSAGAQYNATTPVETTLVGSQAEINKYDMVLFACQGSQYDQSAAAKQIVLNYANAGGRIFATHYSYVWLYDNAPFSSTATWNVDQFANFSSDPETGFIDMTFPKGLQLAQWMKLLYPASVLGQIQIATLRNDFDGVVAPSQLWISLKDPNYPKPVPMHYTFNTPVGAPAASQCGRVVYDDFHVEDALTAGTTFPTECVAGAMTPQEKMLEFMLFDLGSCVTPDVPICTPKSCTQQGIQCGPAGDGCGNAIQCGTCPAGQTCGGGGVASTCGAPSCTPKTCTQLGQACGPAGDGCGNVIQCGSCPSGQTCGGGGTPGACGTGPCVPKTCPALGISCGPASDGCGTVLQCGSCPSGQTCGGGGVAGKCGAPPCTPKTCVGAGANCGTLGDGCGSVIDCGACSLPLICGGGGTANVCGGGPS